MAVADRGDVPGVRWRVDRTNPRAMNATAVATVAGAVADRVAASLAEGASVLVLGGDCTVELGTVAGASREGRPIGLVYVDLDCDLNTPASVTDGALDWMGVAHLLGLADAVTVLAKLGPRSPMLHPEQVLFFANDNATEFERRTIDQLGINEVPLAQVAADPTGAARGVVDGWARQFDRLLVHVDVDVLDFLDLPIAEETRRNRGLRFAQLIDALRILVAAPNWVALTICEVNPDHGELDGSTLHTFNNRLAEALSGAISLAADPNS